MVLYAKQVLGARDLTTTQITNAPIVETLSWSTTLTFDFFIMSITVHQYHRIFPCSESYNLWDITYYDESNWLQDGKGPKRGEIRPDTDKLFAALLKNGAFDNESNLLLAVPSTQSRSPWPIYGPSQTDPLLHVLMNQPGMVYYGSTSNKIVLLNTNHKAYKSLVEFCDTRYHFSITKKANDYLENFLGGNASQSEKAIIKIKEELDSKHIDLLYQAKSYLKSQGVIHG